MLIFTSTFVKKAVVARDTALLITKAKLFKKILEFKLYYLNQVQKISY